MRPSPTGSSGASRFSTREPDLGARGRGRPRHRGGRRAARGAPPRRRPRLRCAGARSSALRCSTTRWCSQRDLLEAHGLRYDTSFGESEDYELWTRVLAVAEGDCVEAPLVLHRLHPQQASRRRGDLQRIARRGGLAAADRDASRPSSPRGARRLARQVWLGADVGADDVEDGRHRRSSSSSGPSRPSTRTSTTELAAVRAAAARALARLAARARGTAGAVVLSEAVRLDPLLPGPRGRASRAAAHARRRRAQRDAADLLRALAAAPDAPPIRVAAVFPEPTPYRAPLLDRVAALPEIDLTVVYAAGTVAGRTWRVEPKHRAVFLRGLRVPGAARVLHHDYPLTPGVVPALEDIRPDVVVVSGWSTFAAQAAIAWCRVRDVPYVLVVESHDEGPRPGWRRTVKDTVVPPIVANAAGVLVTGTLARNSMIARGAPADRVRVFANTVDVEEFGANAVASRGSSIGASERARCGAGRCRRPVRRAPRAGERARRPRASGRRSGGRASPARRRRGGWRTVASRAARR